MKIKSAMNLQGEVMAVTTTPKMITLIKGEQFNAEMDDTTGVIVDGKNMTLALGSDFFRVHSGQVPNTVSGFA